MLQEAVLGPILFFGIGAYINNLEEGITDNILKFAEDTQLLRKNKEIGSKKIQDVIDKLVRWSEKWHDRFSGKKIGLR